jgi:hypothetical protein
LARENAKEEKTMKRHRHSLKMAIRILLVVIVVLGVAALLGMDVKPAAAAAPFLLIPVFGAVYTEPNYLSDVLLAEAEIQASREKVTVLSGENLAIGTVIGKITKALGDITGDAGNTGNGTITDASLGAKAQIGTYTLECIAAAANGGTFKVVAPDGTALPDAEVGTAYANAQLNFTINDGDTDFVVGDKGAIAVDAGSGKVTILNPAAVDGTQNAYGILAAAVDASAADMLGPAITNRAIAKTSGLVWPDGITADQKAAALAELKSVFITTREGA